MPWPVWAFLSLLILRQIVDRVFTSAYGQTLTVKFLPSFNGNFWLTYQLEKMYRIWGIFRFFSIISYRKILTYWIKRWYFDRKTRPWWLRLRWRPFWISQGKLLVFLSKMGRGAFWGCETSRHKLGHIETWEMREAKPQHNESDESACHNLYLR